MTPVGKATIVEEAEVGEAEEALDLQDAACVARRDRAATSPSRLDPDPRVGKGRSRPPATPRGGGGGGGRGLGARPPGGRHRLRRGVVVRPDLRDRAAGARLPEEVEARFDAAGRLELFTGHRSGKALRVHGKKGWIPGFPDRARPRPAYPGVHRETRGEQ